MSSNQARLLQLNAWIAEGEKALFELATGSKVVMLSYSIDGNMQRQFNQASAQFLRDMIAQWKAEAASLGGGGLRRRPMILA